MVCARSGRSVSAVASTARPSRSGGSVQQGSVQQIEDTLSDVVGRQQILQCVPVEERRSLIVLVGPSDLDAEDLAWNLEDLPDPERLDGLVIQDLHSQRVDDSIASIHAVHDRVERFVRFGAAPADGSGTVAAIASEQLECSGRFHGRANHTVRRSGASSVNQATSSALQTVDTDALMRAYGEHARDRRQLQRVVRHEGDAEERVIVTPPGRTEQGEMERLA